jgi:hypothetical protein
MGKPGMSSGEGPEESEKTLELWPGAGVPLVCQGRLPAFSVCAAHGMRVTCCPERALSVSTPVLTGSELSCNVGS